MNRKGDKRCPFQLDVLNFDSREHMFILFQTTHIECYEVIGSQVSV